MTNSPDQPAADRSLYSVDEVGAMIAAGDALLLAGEEQLLAALPQGRWIGGTIPYFMTHEAGGTFDRDRIFVQRLPDMAAVHAQHLLPADALSTLADGGPDNGFTVILLPSQSIQRIRRSRCAAANGPGCSAARWSAGSRGRARSSRHRQSQGD